MLLLWSLQVCATTQVLKSLDCPSASKPFAIRDQYKANMGSKEEVPGEGEVAEQPAPDVEPPRKKAKVDGDVAWDYSKQRSQFIQKLKDGGMKHAAAVHQWNESSLKKSILAPLTISELIRRRFVPAGTTTNPWAQRGDE